MKQISTYLPEPEEMTFEEWYQGSDRYCGYPKKANRAKAEALYNKLSRKDRAKAVIDVPDRLERHSQWKDKQYIPAADVYLRNKKFDDDIVQARTKEQEQETLEDGSNLSRFWTLLKQTYGDERVKRQYGETMPFMWRKALGDLNKREIAKIISYLMNDTEEGLPTLSKVCRIKRIGREFGARQKLLTNPSKPETVRESIEKMKNILKRRI